MASKFAVLFSRRVYGLNFTNDQLTGILEVKSWGALVKWKGAGLIMK